jgi:hypothetical protein
MEAPQVDNNQLNLNGLSQKDRKNRLWEIVKAFPTHVPYSERLHQVAAQAGISPKTLFQLAKRNDWQALLMQEVAAEKERQAYADALQAAAPPQVEIPSTRIASSVKGLVWTLLAASRRYVDTCCLMLSYYSDKIALRIAEAGGLAQLDATAAKEVGELQAKLGYYAKQLQPYMAPGPISTLLNTIDFTSRLPVNDETIDATAFTINRLQKTMLEMGMGSAFQNPHAATAAFTNDPLPVISGWINHSNNSPIEYFNENEPDNL